MLQIDLVLLRKIIYNTVVKSLKNRIILSEARNLL